MEKTSDVYKYLSGTIISDQEHERFNKMNATWGLINQDC